MNNATLPKQPLVPGQFSVPVLNSNGNILVYIVVVILIFGVLGVSLVSLFSTATQSGATPNDAKRARYIAESGIRYALSEIRNTKNFLETAKNLNETTKFYLGKDGSFTVGVFSPGLKSAENKWISNFGGSLSLDVPYSGQFPDGFTIPNVSIVHWGNHTGASHPDNSSAAITAYTIADPPDSVTIDVADDFQALIEDTVCFALLAKDAQTNTSESDSIFVAEEAANLFPAEAGAIRIVTQTDNRQYDVFYEKRLPPAAGRVELTNLRAMPGGAPWTNIADLKTTDYVILSPYNFRVFATGMSNDVTIEFGNENNNPFWAYVVPSDAPLEPDWRKTPPNQTGDLIKPPPGGEQGIDLGPGNSGGEGFGDILYGGDYSLGGNDKFCKDGRCIFGDGIRVFFTADVIPGANGGQGFTFAIIAGGTLFTPVNTRLSVGGDFQLPELLAYGGAGLKSDGTFLDPVSKGLIPPKMALEFDTRTNFDGPLYYCDKNFPNTNLRPGSRNDPKPKGAEKDVLQYVFWGNNDPNDFDLACRTESIESYDDNRHDAEGDQVAENFVFPVGDFIRSEPTYDPTDQTVYFTSDYNGTANFWAVNTDDGTLKWRYNAANRNITSKPALDTISSERLVYFSAADDLYKLKADPPAPPAGESVWLRNVNDFFDKVSPVVDKNNHKIYIGSRTSEKFYAYEADGTRLWEKDLANNIEATAVIDKSGGASDGNVYVGTGDDNTEPDARVYGFAPDALPPDPAPLWPYFITNNDVSSRPALKQDGSALYAVTDTGNLYAINPITGAQIWANLSDIGSVNYIDLAVWDTGAAADGTIYVATDIGELHAIDPANGNEKWQKSLVSGITYSSPAVGPDGTIYIGTNGNRVFAINPDGTTKWIFPIPGGFDVQSTPEVGADGAVYVGANDGNLYALATVAIPRNFRNAYSTGQRGYLTSDNLDSTVAVDDPDNWLDGSPMSKGPWAVRTEIKRATSVNGNGNYEYTLLTWLRQCAQSDCSDIKDTPFQDTTGEYTFLPGPPFPDLPFEQVIELTPAEHTDFERFLFGFTTAASATDTQTVEIRDFQLTFSQSGDPTIIADPTWLP